MNATKTRNDDHYLDRFIDAARSEFSDDDVNDAAHRLRKQLPRSPARRAKVPAVLRWSGAVLFVAAAAALGPLLLPGNGGSAFAQVQKWFADYETVHLHTIMHHGASKLLDFHVWSNDEGATRIEMEEITHIIDPHTHSMHTLLPGKRIMTQTITPDTDAETRMEWLHEIRDFQGQAEPIHERRLIDGVEAAGWRLVIDGSQFTLWADAATNKPLLVEAELAGGVRMLSTLHFDRPLPEGALEIPEGYHPVHDDE